MDKILGILGILFLLLEVYRWLRRKRIQHILEQKKRAKQPRKPAVLRPKSEEDCRFCMEGKGNQIRAKRAMPVAWSERKGRGGRRKGVSTEGYFCSNKGCEYYEITDERIHALVGDGRHGKSEEIRDIKCQNCGKKFTVRKHTILYRLKTHSEMVGRILWLIGLGVDASALEEVFGVRENTIRSWLWRSGVQGRKLHERFMVELELIHVQLDEQWVNAKSKGKDLWLWAVTDAKTKIVLVLQVGGRTQEMAYQVVHELKGRLKVGWVPVFSTDGLKHYYYF